MSGADARGQRSSWGWGDERSHLDASEQRALGEQAAALLGVAPRAPMTPRDVGDLHVPAPRLRPPAALAAIVDATAPERVAHARGNSFRDVVRAFHGELPTYPDLVVFPRAAVDVVAILDWVADAGAVCIPFGGGTSVVGGVDPPALDRPVVTLDLRAMGRLLEVDPTSLAAHIEGGATGPDIEDALRPDGLTLRFFPQSWEFSTLGGWIATRAAGHYATLQTHIDDLVESVRAETPTGRWESRRVPASGAGPSPDRLLLGSEGTLGVITDAWVRVQRRPTFRAAADVTFASFDAGCDAVRALAQSGLYPANCRLLDPGEALVSGAGDGSAALLVLGFESADHPVEAALARAIELCADHSGRASSLDGATPDSDGSASWRRTFLRAPYLRDALVALGFVVETFETATTWDRLHATVAVVIDAVRAAATEVCGAAAVTARLTHAYPDGAAPYFTVIAPGRRGAEVAQWDEIKVAASEALLAAGATITHHHAIGRDHRPWYDRQRPEPFARALAAAKAAVDPRGVLNPGVLLG